MGLGSLNYLAVMAAAIASFVFGGVWYNAFSKQWMEAVGMSPERVTHVRTKQLAFRRLAEAMGKPEWLADPRFATNPARVENREHVNASLQAIFGKHPRAYWIATLDAARVPCAELQTVDEVLAHPQSEALAMLQDTPDGQMQFMGTPLSFSGVRPPMQSGPPELGADTAMVLGMPTIPSRSAG